MALSVESFFRICWSAVVYVNVSTTCVCPGGAGECVLARASAAFPAQRSSSPAGQLVVQPAERVYLRVSNGAASHACGARQHPSPGQPWEGPGTWKPSGRRGTPGRPRKAPGGPWQKPRKPAMAPERPRKASGRPGTPGKAPGSPGRALLEAPEARNGPGKLRKTPEFPRKASGRPGKAPGSPGRALLEAPEARNGPGKLRKAPERSGRAFCAASARNFHNSGTTRPRTRWQGHTTRTT